MIQSQLNGDLLGDKSPDILLPCWDLDRSEERGEGASWPRDSETLNFLNFIANF